MTHTKGPWEMEEVPSAGLSIVAKVDIGKDDMSDGILQPIYDVSLRPQLWVDNEGTVTMQISYSSWRQFPSANFKKMQQANAHLIAAAPDLLEALKEALASVEFMASATDADPEDHERLAHVKAAFAKAGG